MPSELEDTVKKRAGRLGLTVDQLLVHDRDMLRNSSYPTTDCISPDELLDEKLVNTLAHVLECPMCAAQVMVAHKNRHHDRP